MIFQKFLAKILYCTLITLNWKRKVVSANLNFVHPGITKTEIAEFYRKLLRELSQTAAEFVLGNANYRNLLTSLAAYPCKNRGKEFLIAEDSLQTLQKMKRGGVFLTAHYGNYEAIGHWFCRLGLPVAASYAKIRPNFLNNLLERRLRSVNGTRYSVFIQNPKQILTLLDSGRLFCLLADQDYRKKSALPGEFLGRQVSCNPIPGFILRHRAQTPFYLCWLTETAKSSTLHAKEISSTPETVYAEFHSQLEALIRQNPATWFGWTHRRFLGQHKTSTIYQHCSK